LPLQEPWTLKLRRRIQAPINKIFRRNHYFLTRYYGADFLLPPGGIGTLETSSKIFEYPELTHLMRRCVELRPELLIDIGANRGIYTCILLRHGSAPRSACFEPDRVNLIQLKANLLINGVLDRATVHEVALGDANRRMSLVPGPQTTTDYSKVDGGFSRVAETGGEYEVEMARLDDVLLLSGRTLVIKMDVERFECRVVAGMQRTLRENKCLVQIEVDQETRDQIIEMMKAADYLVTKEFFPNLVFENARSSR